MEPSDTQKSMEHTRITSLVLVKPGCREPAHEFLNRISIYAAALELGAAFKEPAIFLRTFPFTNKLGRILYAPYARYLDRRYSRSVLRAWRPPVFLPPTAPLPQRVANAEAIYLFGWLYRNPAGLEKFKTRIRERFAPPKRIRRAIERILAPLHPKLIIGVYIRTRPFTGFPDGSFIVSPERTRRVVDEYLAMRGINRREVALAVVSDARLSPDIFEGYTASFLVDQSLLGLYLLAECQVIIGDNSILSNTAAWWGDIAHIVAADTPIEWEYYKGKEHYFENKYATFAH